MSGGGLAVLNPNRPTGWDGVPQKRQAPSAQTDTIDTYLDLPVRPLPSAADCRNLAVVTLDGRVLIMARTVIPLWPFTQYSQRLFNLRRSRNTTEAAAHALVGWIRHAVAKDYPLWSPSKDQMAAYIAHATRERGWSESTVNQTVYRLWGFFQYIESRTGHAPPFAMRESRRFALYGKPGRYVPALVHAQPANNIDLPTRSALHTVLDALDAHLRLPADIMLDTGARVAEMLQAPRAWQNRTTLATGAIKIPVTRKGNRPGFLIVGAALAKRIGDHVAAHGSVFKNCHGRPLTGDTMSSGLRRAAKRVAGDKPPMRINAHLCRHWFATHLKHAVDNLIATGVAKTDLRNSTMIIQQAMGHRYATSTEMYVHTLRQSDVEYDEAFVQTLLGHIATAGIRVEWELDKKVAP